MDTLYVQLISAVVWPVTVLIILPLFRRTIRDAFRRVDSAKLPGGTEFTFGTTPADKRTEREALPTPYDDIVHGLTQTIHHLEQAGLNKVSAFKRLNTLRATISKPLKSSLTSQMRSELALELRRVADQLGVLAEAKQGTFVPSPIHETNSA